MRANTKSLLYGIGAAICILFICAVISAGVFAIVKFVIFKSALQ